MKFCICCCHANQEKECSLCKEKNCFSASYINKKLLEIEQLAKNKEKGLIYEKIGSFKEAYFEFVSNVEKRIISITDIMQDRIINIENHFTDILHNFEKRINMLEYFTDINCKDNECKEKTPHKCPVCEGRGIIQNGLKIEEVYGTNLKTCKDCHSCEGEGIVWG
jgi:DnaJ-class molecular chaperone